MFDRAARLLDEGVLNAAFPGAVAEVGRTSGVTWRHCAGLLENARDPRRVTIDTVYDLASLTKPIATTSLVMRLVEHGRLSLDDPIGLWLPLWRGRDREGVTVGDLLAHCSGLTAHLPFYRDCEGRADFERAICTMPLEYTPGSSSVYSDLGFILLGFIVQDVAGHPLDDAFVDLVARLGISGFVFRPPRDWRERIAPTGLDTWRGRVLVGEVHDRNASALGGVAGHAGLFGTVQAVGEFARVVLRLLRGDAGAPGLAHPATMQQFARRTHVPGSSRALGWDTMLPTSSCGTRMHPTAIGHTGFTGTSLWIDAMNDLYVALLTNRVHPDGENDRILALRPPFHDAVMAELQV